MIRLIAGLVFLAAAVLAGCKEEVAMVKPAPVAMTAEAVGHYCQMNVLEHVGPKAQIFISGLDHPLWFGQVRDAIAYLRLPEETDRVVAVYVQDIGKAESWEAPGTTNFIDADEAFFVVGSSKRGGLGAPEAIPFSDEAAAHAFVSEHNGEVMRLKDIPDSYVLSPVETSSADPSVQGNS